MAKARSKKPQDRRSEDFFKFLDGMTVPKVTLEAGGITLTANRAPLPARLATPEPRYEITIHFTPPLEHQWTAMAALVDMAAKRFPEIGLSELHKEYEKD